MAKIINNIELLPPINRRLYELVLKYTEGNVTAFSRELGIQQQKIDRLFKPDKRSADGKYPSVEDYIIESVISKYNGVTKEWLLLGKRDSITKQEDPERQAKEISISNSDIKEGEYCGTLVYDIDGTCGKEGRDITFTYDDVIGCVNLPEIKKDSKIITASGDSMEPVIYSGDRVVIREIFDWNDIFYGQIYMILMDEYRMIKYIRKYEEDENKYIILRSRNKEYDDMRFERSKIKRLFIIENILSVKTQI
ncbi:MAG: S24 family peptidase [Bacteroides sp.]